MNQGTYKQALAHYIIGFVGSLVLTLLAYSVVVYDILNGWQAALVVAGLALVQFAVQLMFFLHVTAGSRPRWKLATFWFMLLILFILIAGSLWIMYVLNYRMMMPSTEEMLHYMHSQSGF